MHKTFLLGAFLLILSTPSSAALIDAFSVPIIGTVAPGQTIFLGTQATGVLFTNQSANEGVVSIELVQGPPGGPNDRVAEGFELLDGTLRISTNVPDGEKRVRVRMGYSEQRILRRGLRLGSQRLFRRARLRTGARWGRAVRAVQGRATIRRFARSGPVPGLGHFGFDASESYVWSFLDVSSDFAVAARTVAEPTSMMLIVGGLGLISWSTRRKPSRG